MQDYIETGENIGVYFNPNSNSQSIELLNPDMVSLYSQEFIAGPSVLQKDNVLIGQNSFSSESQTFSKNTKKEREYIVQKGDSLSVIADKFNVSVSTIVWENNITKNIINIGQKLTILPVNGVNHTVKSGDTLSSIVKKYEGDIDLTRDFNFLAANDTLNIGDKILVVGGKGEASVPKVAAPKAVSSSTYVSYVSSGYYGHPAPGSVRTQGLHDGKAVDFGAAPWTPILASASGTVRKSSYGGWGGGYGNHVIISHPNGTRTLYAHMIQNNVYVGQYVVKGQIIGYMGSTGRSTGTHLHFEVIGAPNPFR